MSGEVHLGKMISGSVKEVLGDEDLLLEVVRDMIKDEIKERIQKALEENPEIKAELEEALEEYYKAKMRQTLAVIKIAKSSVHLGLRTVPADLQDDVHKELEKEITRIIDDTL
ncbi:MAG: nitrite reductase [Candidatus Thermoplasmatota archaeon]|nr:nitrite reductase [Candidatus Thermoplasmatota archaeon]